MTRMRAGLLACYAAALALLLWAGYYWLGMNEGDGWHLFGSMFVLALLLAAAAEVQGIVLLYFQLPDKNLTETAKIGVRNIVPLFVFVMLIAVLYGVLAFFTYSLSHLGFQIASYLTMALGHPVKPELIVSLLNAVIRLVQWLILPVLLLPTMGRVVAAGWSGFRFTLIGRKPIYWAEVLILLVAGVWLPLRLLRWVPHFDPFALQMMSFLLRLAAGYLLFVSAFLLLAFVTAGGKPLPSQETTVASP